MPPFIRLDRHGTCLIFDLRESAAAPVHIGEPLAPDEDLASLCAALRRERHGSQPDQPAPRAILPQTGWGHQAPPAVVLQRGGSPLGLHFQLVDASQSSDGLDFVHHDPGNGLNIVVNWQVAESGVVQTQVRLTNASTEPLTLVALASLVLPLPTWASHVTRYAGRWAGEMQQRRSELAPGEIGSASFGGRPGFGGGNWIRIESPEFGEHQGHGIAAHLAWSGDHSLQIARSAEGDATLTMAARLDPGEVTLQPGATFAAPRALFAVSARGLAALRHGFHRHAINHTIPKSAATTPRKVHINSWEALGFDQSLPRLTQLADGAAALGIERFVLDDGWFAGRRDDTTSLGDWHADAGLFPEGLAPLIRHVAALGMDFGLWVEPEMVSPDSDLYRRNPDWCLHVPGQPRPTQRSQLVLDLTQDAVCDYLFDRLDALLSSLAIAYLKWDHNRDLFPLAGKGHAQVQALYALLDRLRAAHPNVEIETCASGGGRVDFEILRRCSRFWASDNNDAIERLGINAGWFDFLPLRITGNHVGPSPNPITGRRLAMDFRARVALFGHMGVEADPGAMEPQERASLAAHIALYKQWREVLHGGELVRLADGSSGLHGWLAMAGRRGLALIAQTRQTPDYDLPHIRFASLDPALYYRVQLLDPGPGGGQPAIAAPEALRQGLVLSGRALAHAGISLPLSRPEMAWLLALEQLE